MRLSFFDSQGNKNSREFHGALFIIGRNPECDFVIANETVSARHASISKINGNFVLSDLNSTNGTLVNGVWISKKAIHPNDLMQFGGFQCWWNEENAQAQGFQTASVSAARPRVRFPVVKGGKSTAIKKKEQNPSTSSLKIFQSLEHSVCTMTENTIIRTYHRKNFSHAVYKEKPEVKECFESGQPHFLVYPPGGGFSKNQESGSLQTQPLTQFPNLKRRRESLIKNAVSLRVAFPVSFSAASADAVLYLEHLRPAKVTYSLLKKIKKHISAFIGQSIAV